VSAHDIDLGRLIRTLQVHLREEADDHRCDHYCALDIRALYEDPDLMELTAEEEAAEAATW
jgi:hypothetical protein